MQNKPEFQLALTIFVAISIIGTIFGLWFANQYIGISARSSAEPRTEQAAAPPEPKAPPVTIPNQK